MTTISAYAKESNSPQANKAARSWSLRSLQVANQAVKDGGGLTIDDPARVLCGRAKAVAAHTLGTLAEVFFEPSLTIYNMLAGWLILYFLRPKMIDPRL